MAARSPISRVVSSFSLLIMSPKLVGFGVGGGDVGALVGGIVGGKGDGGGASLSPFIVFVKSH